MLFDVAFLFFLGATAGLRGLFELLLRGAARRAAAAAATLALLFVVGIDLPWRLRTEYRDYNQAPTGVRDAIARQGIRNAVVFFGAEKAYACYTPYNAITFDGDVVYARVQGELLDYLLLTRYPGKQAWFSPDGNALVKRPNFYRKDLATLKADLAALGARDATVVMPWREVAPTPLDDALKPAEAVEPGRFLARLAGAARARRGRRSSSRARRSSRASRTSPSRPGRPPSRPPTRGRSRSGRSGPGGRARPARFPASA